jgi:hypothetical protein
MIHVSLEQLSSYLDGELLDSSSGPIRTHVEQCVQCRLLLTAMKDLDAVLARELTHGPSARFLERLPGEIERRAGIKGVDAPRQNPAAASPAPLPVETSPPRRLAPEVTPPRHVPPRSTERIVPASPRASRAASQRTRSTARRSGISRPWIAGVILIAIGAAVGIVVAPRVRDDARNSIQLPKPAATEESKSEEPNSAVDPGQPLAPPIPDSSTPAESPTPAPEIPAPHVAAPKPVRAPATKPRVTKPEEDASALSTGNFVPVRKTITVTEMVPVRPPAPTPRPRRADLGPFAGAPAAAQPLVLDAVRAAQKASLDPSAANFDTAAAEWERVIPALKGTAQQTVARQHVADARFQAWRADPTASRSATTIAALRRYIVFAPDGPAREAARAELARMSH